MNWFKSIFIGFLVGLFSVAAVAQEKSIGLVEKAQRKVKMAEARHFFLENNAQSALSIYRVLADRYPDFTKAFYRAAESAYEIKRFDLAQKYMEATIQQDVDVDPELPLLAGKVYHRLGVLDSATSWYQRYIRENGAKKSSDAIRYLKEVERCKVAQTDPLDVEIKWLGEAVNSRYDDYSPIVVEGGKRLIFGTRRPRIEGSLIDEGGDYKYFEDIYTSEFKNGEWTQAEILPGKINTTYHDGILGASEDGSTLYIYKNNGRVKGDIYISKKSEKGEYGFPRKFEEVNSSYYEGSISFTSDGNTAYFISERKGGFGHGDIWVTHKNGALWSEPVNAGPLVNSTEDEKFVFIHPNGLSLIFASNGGEGFGDYDLYKSEIVNGQFTKPVNLGYPINSVGEESTFSLTQDFNTLYLSTEREDAMGERDIYSVDLSAVGIIDKPITDDPSQGVLQGWVMNVDGERLAGVEVTITAPGFEKRVTTDAAGTFEIALDMSLVYTIETKPKGYLSKQETLNFSQLKTNKVVKHIQVQGLADSIDED